MLLKRNMSAAELFQSCDADWSGSVSLEELKSNIGNIERRLVQKDLQGIKKFFEQKDKDRNG